MVNEFSYFDFVVLVLNVFWLEYSAQKEEACGKEVWKHKSLITFVHFCYHRLLVVISQYISIEHLMLYVIFYAENFDNTTNKTYIVRYTHIIKGTLLLINWIVKGIWLLALLLPWHYQRFFLYWFIYKNNNNLSIPECEV